MAAIKVAAMAPALVPATRWIFVAGLIECQYSSDERDPFDATAFEREIAPQFRRTGRSLSVFGPPSIEVEQTLGGGIELALELWAASVPSRRCGIDRDLVDDWLVHSSSFLGVGVPARPNCSADLDGTSGDGPLARILQSGVRCKKADSLMLMRRQQLESAPLALESGLDGPAGPGHLVNAVDPSLQSRQLVTVLTVPPV